MSTFHSDEPFKLESGATLPGFHLRYTTYGQLNAVGDNVIWVLHALTANSDPGEWWPGLVGHEKPFDPDRHFIVCANMPGSCYGSIGPLSTDPVSGKPYFHQFPFFTTRDMIRAYQRLRVHLGIRRIKVGIGGSMGGQQLLEWAVEEPALFENIVPIATNAQHSPWGQAFNASQRLAIETDPSWGEQSPVAGLKGLKVARSIALLSYRHYRSYQESQQADSDEIMEGYPAESYQSYQGDKLVRRFNAFSYYALTRSMDAHHVGRGRGGVVQALGRIRAKALVIGIEHDVLFPVSEQVFLAKHIPGAILTVIKSPYGHDGFLLEYEQLEKEILDFVPGLQPQRVPHRLKTVSSTHPPLLAASVV